MRRVMCVLLFLLLITVSVPLASAEVSISAEAAVLYCPDNGKIYYSKNENKRMRPASTTKLMTAWLTLEYASKHNKKVRFTEEMSAEGSSMYLKFGEVVTLKDLAAGLLMCSGNDAANAAAISIAGSKEKFASLMNSRARKIGMNHTHFVTPSGLDDDDHYSTAADLAVLMSNALKNPDFAQLCGKKSASVHFVKPKSKVSSYANHNRLLSLFPDCIGGKTGYTMAAGRCLVTAAKRDGLTLIAVTLNDKRDWDDHITLYNYGFDNYKMKQLDDTDCFIDVKVVGSDSKTVTVGSAENDGVVLSKKDYKMVKRTVYLDNFLYSPIKKNEEVGEIVYTLNGEILARHRLRAVQGA